MERRYDLMSTHDRANNEICVVDLSIHSVEGRLFEDPTYLMQYNLLSQGCDPSFKTESVENSAFITAENEIYLAKVWFIQCIDSRRVLPYSGRRS